MRDLGELLAALELRGDEDPRIAAAQRDFPLRVPWPYVRRIRKRDPADPLLLQILPRGQEVLPDPAGRSDPLDEGRRQPLPGLIHKYSGRVLWMLTGACALHCRYCFRRQLPYSAMTSGPAQARTVCDWLRRNQDVTEVILSGGDPLSLPDQALAAVADQIAAVGQVRVLRLHTRLPIALPARVDSALLSWLDRCRLDKVAVLHLNHGREIDAEVEAAVGRLADAGVRLYAQSVLLAGVNDSADELQRLFDRLWSIGVQPYYLHLLDPVRGAAHFDVPEWRARQLYGQVCSRMAGYRLPRLVRETPGLPAKSLVPPMFAGAAFSRRLPAIPDRARGP